MSYSIYRVVENVEGRYYLQAKRMNTRMKSYASWKNIHEYSTRELALDGYYRQIRNRDNKDREHEIKTLIIAESSDAN